jgi:hypothetical protein
MTARLFDIRPGGVSASGDHLPGFVAVRVGGLSLTVLSRWLRWPRGMRLLSHASCVVVRYGPVVLCWWRK